MKPRYKRGDTYQFEGEMYFVTSSWSFGDSSGFTAVKLTTLDYQI